MLAIYACKSAKASYQSIDFHLTLLFELALFSTVAHTVTMKSIIIVMALMVCCLVAVSLATVMPNVKESKLEEIEELEELR